MCSFIGERKHIHSIQEILEEITAIIGNRKSSSLHVYCSCVLLAQLTDALAEENCKFSSFQFW